MTSRAVDAVVLDVLGTLVDEPSGLRAEIRALLPQAAEGEVDEALELWQHHIETEQQSIVDGGRPFLNSEALDLEAAQLVADRFGVTDPASIAMLGTAGQRLPPWPDSIVGLNRLAARLPLIGLSNASRSALLRLNAHAGLRWHQALSAEAARTYKPAPEVYRLAIETAARPPERLVMVAAHAWDLRGAQALGMRTAYVQRPVGDPPTASDRFDWHVQNLGELADHLHDVVG
jgi:2-haloacid dehalogenase